MQDPEAITREADVDRLLQQSRREPLVIFKHSTSCSISHLAKARMDRALTRGELAYPLYYLDLLRYRSVSDYISERLGVRHESPQAIVIGGEEVLYVASHLDIDPSALGSGGVAA